MRRRAFIALLGEMLGLDIPPTLLALADEVARFITLLSGGNPIA